MILILTSHNRTREMEVRIRTSALLIVVDGTATADVRGYSGPLPMLDCSTWGPRIDLDPYVRWTHREILEMVFGRLPLDLRRHYQPPSPRSVYAAVPRYNHRSQPRWPRGRWKAKT